MKNEILKNKRLKILSNAKKHIPFDGWNEKILSTVANDLKIPINEIHALFPKNYRDLLELYLEDSESKMLIDCKKLNISNMKIDKKIYEIIFFRIKKNLNNKELIRKTFFALSLPKNSLLGISSLYKTVDNIWFLAGDNSLDFNFYTKRLILAGIYTTVLLYWFNDDNKDLKRTKSFLIKQIKRTSFIKKIKNSIVNVGGNTSNILNLKKRFKSIY